MNKQTELHLSAFQQEALRLIFEQRSQELRAETEIAYKLVAAFVAAELALSTWLVTSPIVAAMAALLIFVMNFVVGVLVIIFIWRNYGRRAEIIATIDNILDAWKLREVGAYITGKHIYFERYGHSWRNLYLLIILLMCSAQAIPLWLIPQ